MVAFACVIYPVYVIRPFRAQGPRELAFALDVMRFRGPVLLGCLVATLAAVWFGTRRRWAAALALFSVAAAAVLARVNIYERMFHPNMSPQFQAVSASPLAGPERVIAVKVSANRGPIRSGACPITTSSTTLLAARHRRDLLNALSHRSGVEARC